MVRYRSGIITTATVLLCLAIAVATSSAAVKPTLVTCGSKTTISSVLATTTGPIAIVVQGTCTENVVIDRDDVTLQGDPGGGGIASPDPTKDVVTIDRANRVVLSGLTISGGRHGVLGKNGAVFSVLGSTVQNNVQNGVLAIFGATVTVDSAVINGVTVPSQLVNNGSGGDPDRGLNGLALTDNSSGTARNSTFSGNGSNGISVSRSSSARIGINTSAVAGPNTITGNGASGISVFQSSQALVYGNTIQNNLSNGISLDMAAAATIVLNAIESNGASGVSVTNSAGARIGLTDRNLALRRGDGSTNAIRSNTSHGISVTQGANANLYGNLVEMNGGHGVLLRAADMRSSGDNRIQNNALDGVAVILGHYTQGQDFGLTPFRDFVTGNGTFEDPNNNFGIISFDGSAMRLENIEVSGNTRDGILVGDSSTLDLRSADPSNPSLVTNNGFAGSIPPFNNVGSGITLINGGSADIRGATITANKVNGVNVNDKSMASIRSHALLVNGTPTAVLTTISGNATNGVSCFDGSVVTVSRNTTITANGTPGAGPGFPIGSGIAASLGCAVSVTDSTISANQADGINLSGNSVGRLLTSSVGNPPFDGYFDSFVLNTVVSGNGRDGIGVFGNSQVSLQTVGGALPGSPPVSVTGNLRGINCNGTSLANGNLGAVTGNTTNFSGNVLVNVTFPDQNGVSRTALSPTPLTASGGTCQ